MLDSNSCTPNEDPNAVLVAALDYASRDWRVIPLLSETKQPFLKNWPHLATTDPQRIREWFSGRPPRSLGIATGSRSRLLVVDLDGDGVRGIIEQRCGPLPSTYEVATTRGRHLYYQIDVPCWNRNGFLGLKVDIRGDGGQVAAPPSVHPESGVIYERVGDHEIVPAPNWLVEAVRRPDGAIVTSDEVPGLSCLHGTRRRATEALLYDASDWEEDDAVRYSDRERYRSRHRALWSVILSELQRGCDEECVLGTIRGSTLWAKARRSSPTSPERWVRDQIRSAQVWLDQHPAGWIEPGDHRDLAERYGGTLSAGQRKVLAAIQARVYRDREVYGHDIGWVSMSQGDLAMASSQSKGSIGKALDRLEEAGWIKVRKSKRGDARASSIALQLPRSLTIDDLERGEGEDSANLRNEVRGEESSPSPHFRTWSDLHEVNGALDAFRHGALGSTHPTVLFLAQHLDEGFIATNEIARRLGRPARTIGTHVKKLDEHGLIERNDARAVKLVSDFKPRLLAVAVQLGVDGVGERQRLDLREERILRRQSRRKYALESGLELKHQPVPEHPWPTF